jgi:hypothetical protein
MDEGGTVLSTSYKNSICSFSFTVERCMLLSYI